MWEASAQHEALVAVRRPHDLAGFPERGEARGQQLDPPAALPATLTEELARQIGFPRLQEVVDPVVDLAEEAAALSWAHAESMVGRPGETKRKLPGLPTFYLWTSPLRCARLGG